MCTAITFLLLVTLAGCGSTETKDDAPKSLVVAAPAQDTPPPAWTMSEAPDFADPKPPVRVAPKPTNEVETTRERLLHGDHNDGR